jgi:TRAP-type C4-dicarboxylate transport system permease large subunit
MRNEDLRYLAAAVTILVLAQVLSSLGVGQRIADFVQQEIHHSR